jgi:hypothetical protein
MIYEWEVKIIRHWTTNEIKNCIWAQVSCGQPAPGQVSVNAMRYVLRERGENDRGYHDT